MVVGVGIGGDFEYAAILAKKALCRPVDSENPNPYYRQLEADLLQAVNALDIALRTALAGFYPTLADVRLVDYKVRVMDSRQATAAKTRVLITSADGEKEWTTVGVSNDVIEASWVALSDSIAYKLISDKEETEEWV